MSVHAKLSPSSAKIWVPCTASVAYIQAARVASIIPDEDPSSVYSSEGTEAHEWAAKVNREEILITDVPEDFRPHVKTFCDECWAVWDRYRYPGSEIIYIEDTVPLFYSPAETGTIDYAMAGRDIGVHINDLKYGRGVYVEAEENLQLAIYANSVRCAIERKLKGFTFADTLPVSMTIVQPRYLGAAPVRTWMTDIGNLKDFCMKIADSVLDIETGDSKRLKFEPSEDTCQFCPARFIPCIHKAMAAFSIVPKMKKDPLSLLPDLNAIPVPVVEYMTDDQLVAVKRGAPLLQQFIKDAENALLQRALADPANLPPGLKWVRGREGNREWKDEPAAEEWLAKRLDEDDYAPRKLVSPTVAKSLLGGMPPKVKAAFEDLISRAPSKEVLAVAEDKRDPIAPGALKGDAIASLPDLSEVE